MNHDSPHNCPDCDDAVHDVADRGVNRREFVRAAGATALGAAAVASGAGPLLNLATAGETKRTGKAETTVKRFYDTLSDEQKKTICFPFDHKLRSRISANWHVTKPTIGDDFYSKEQRKLIDDVLRGVTSEDGYGRFQKQMDEDDGGVDFYSVAVFGQPGAANFEWMMTGRHLTVRADGDSVANTAFGGPIVYGHGESDPAQNLFHYQTKKANSVFEALDPKQREQALVAEAPQESAVQLQGDGKTASFPGVGVGDLADNQQELVEEVIKVLLAPYRESDVEEAMSLLKAGGGLDQLHMAFYKQGDLKNDKVWDVWRVEGPTFVWHFRGAPHVHTYVNIGRKA